MSALCQKCKGEVSIKGLSKVINAGMTAGIGREHGDMIGLLFAEFIASGMENGLCLRHATEALVTDSDAASETKKTIKAAMQGAINS